MVICGYAVMGEEGEGWVERILEGVWEAIEGGMG